MQSSRSSVSLPLLALTGLAACGYDGAGCRLGNEVEGRNERTVFAVSSPLSYRAGWPLAVGDQFAFAGESAGNAPVLAARTSDASVLSVLEQQPRTLSCAGSRPCDPAAPTTKAIDHWTVVTVAEGDAELHLAQVSGESYDQMSVSS